MYGEKSKKWKQRRRVVERREQELECVELIYSGQINDRVGLIVIVQLYLMGPGPTVFVKLGKIL